MGAYEDHEVPIIVRGDGCYVYDEHGKRYLDGLSALFCVNAGHGRAEIGEAMAKQAPPSSASTPIGATPTRRRSNSPGASPIWQAGDLNRVFFTSGGSESVEAALKLVPGSYHKLRGQAGRYQVFDLGPRDRLPRHDDGKAFSATGMPVLRTPYEPLMPGSLPMCPTPTATTGLKAAIRSGPRTPSRSGSSSRDPRGSPR